MSTDDVYVSTTFMADKSELLDVLELCREHCINHVELGSNHVFDPDFAGIVERFDFQYLVHNYFPIPRESFVMNIASSDDAIRERSLHHIMGAIDFCGRIGALLYTFHPGFITDPRGEGKDPSNYDFEFVDSDLGSAGYRQAFNRMLDAVSRITDYAGKKNVSVAIETQGSASRHEHLLLQKPEEYEELFRSFPADAVGINLNVAHTRLVSSVYGFESDKFVDLVSEHVVAMELSHSNGKNDDHLPLVAGEWYWDLIRDNRFVDAHKILEFRNTPVDEVIETITLLN